ncbi:MAG: outer membrane beta-barrel protein [Gemmatimonadales bacterium]
MRKLIGIAVVGLIVAAAPVAGAQAPSFWLGAGVTMPQGDYGDLASMGFHGMGAVSFGLGAGPLGVRVEGVYHRTSLENNVDGNTSIIGAMASLMYSFATPGGVKPYVLGGAGYYKADAEITGLGSFDESDLGYGFGGGLQFALGGTNLFAEVRYITVGGDVDADFLPITVGIKLGGK